MEILGNFAFSKDYARSLIEIIASKNNYKYKTIRKKFE